MKKQNLWRILTLALALVMLFSVVACNNDGAADATTEATEADGSTLSTEATTEKPNATTEKPTTATTTEPTTEPTTEAPTQPQEPAPEPPVVDPGKATTLDKWGDNQFSMMLPDAFTVAGAIKIEGAGCEAGCTEVKASGSTRFNLSTYPASGAASAMGVVKLLPNESQAAKDAKIYHYYIDWTSPDSTKFNNGNQLSWEQCYIRWTFTVTEAGTYQVASYHRIKADVRSGLIQFDDQDPVIISYKLSSSKFEEVNDGYAGAYLNWEGFTVELSAGTHTLTYMLDPAANGTSMHWRDIYLVKIA